MSKHFGMTNTKLKKKKLLHKPHIVTTRHKYG